jgi:dTMP kinase
MTLLFDVPLDVARERLDKTRTLDKFEREKHDFFEKVRNAYLQRAAQFPQRIRVVDSTQPLANVNQQLEQLIDQLDE